MMGKVRERLVELALLGCSILTVAAMAIIVGTLAAESSGFFSRVPLSEFLTGLRWTPLFSEKSFGVVPLVAGTLLTSSIALAVALAVGLGSAIYLGEYASERVRRTLKPLMEILAGIPTVVYGYFAISFITPLLKSTLFPWMWVHNALSAGIAMGIMITPMMASLSEDAIYGVPETLRHAAYALGARKVDVVFRVVLPSALPGIAAALILSLARAVGETMIVTIAAGFRPSLSLNPFQAVQTLTAYIAQVATGDAPHGTLEYSSIFAVGLYLFAVVMALNVLGALLVRRWGMGVWR